MKGFNIALSALFLLSFPWLITAPAKAGCSGLINDIISNPSFSCLTGDKLFSNFIGFAPLAGGSYSISEINSVTYDVTFGFSTTSNIVIGFDIDVVPPSPYVISAVTVIPPVGLGNLVLSTSSIPGFPTPFTDLLVGLTYDSGTAESLKFEVQQTPVPAPLSLLGASLSLGFARRIRRRINQCC